MTTKPKWNLARDGRSATLILGHGSMTVDLCVTRHIDLSADEWALHCNALGIRTFSLGRVTLEEAQAATVTLIWRRLHGMLDAIERWRS